MSNLDKDIEKTIKRLKEDIDFNKNRTTIVCFREDVENVLSDRENWKKIAYKLAEILTYLPINENQDYFEIKEDILDWARNEVLKDE